VLRFVGFQSLHNSLKNLVRKLEAIEICARLRPMRQAKELLACAGVVADHAEQAAGG
jgi:hypothetical protein